MRSERRLDAAIKGRKLVVIQIAHDWSFRFTGRRAFFASAVLVADTGFDALAGAVGFVLLNPSCTSDRIASDSLGTGSCWWRHRSTASIVC